jgi:hypothetical protein
MKRIFWICILNMMSINFTTASVIEYDPGCKRAIGITGHTVHFAQLHKARSPLDNRNILKVKVKATGDINFLDEEKEKRLSYVIKEGVEFLLCLRLNRCVSKYTDSDECILPENFPIAFLSHETKKLFVDILKEFVSSKDINSELNHDINLVGNETIGQLITCYNAGLKGK